ncbi:DUF6346 domain-containing protein [Lentzea flava]|uniref:DUF3592 domain-containing protein n=1 Tax=Lentzea flava TaxID=103732 RepID=A0ABQ2UFY9_9PSEU|nr:DUF6346 domain-containing protein [Lentzea flava]MCP2198540.1 hypothetical protein [Lentzea flava]GGU26580.1 hypothetical protein GCM10010178_18700 [Lentzea flava]
MKGHHQRWLAVVWLALCAYGAAFLVLFWEDHGPRGEPVAHADNIQCQRNWLLLGTRWSCTAIVTDQGVRYRYTSDSSLLTPADTSVPMQRLAPHHFAPARASFNPAPWPTMGAVTLVALGLVGTGVLWQNSRAKRPAAKAEARRLRAQARWYVGAGGLAFLAAYFVHGLLITARADVWPRRTEGTGVATSCERDWRYLGAQWRCDVDITAETGQKLAQTMSHSQFTRADIGIPKPVTAIGVRWEAVDQPYEHRFAKALFVLLLAGGMALLIKPTYDLARVRNLENPDLPPRFLPVR